MTADRIRALIEKRRMFYEILPYYVVLDERPAGKRATRKRVQAGFDINLYATGPEKPLMRAGGNEEFRATVEDLQQAAREIVSRVKSPGEIEITPFENSVVLDTHRDLRPEASLRIRITHDRGLAQSEGPLEEEILAEIQQRIRELGVQDGSRGFFK